MANDFPLTASDFADFIRYLEGGLMGFMCLIFVGDMGRGDVSLMIHRVYGYPRWFVPIIGVLQGSVGMATFNQGGKDQWLGQHLLAVLMGGCMYTHVRRGARKKDISSPLALLIFSLLLPYLQGKSEELAEWSAKQLGLAVFGWVVGEVMGLTVCEKVEIAAAEEDATSKEGTAQETKKTK